MSAPRSGPFAWSPLGDGYLVASADPTGRPVVDLVLPSPPDGAFHCVATFGPDDVELLASLSDAAAEPAAPAAPAAPVRLDVGGRAAPFSAPSRARSADRRLTTTGGIALALGVVAVFWIALGVLLWLLLR